jgi:uncharacterized RDD family membrane protein YckC
VPAAGWRGLLRRLAAALYDGLLLAAVLIAATALTLAASGGRSLTVAGSGVVGAVGHRLLLLLLIYLYFGRSWTRGGQTLGMKAWRLRALAVTGSPVTWRRAALRLAWAAPLWLAAVAGTLLALSHRAPLWAAPLGWLPIAISLAPLLWGQPALHDRLSGTRMVRLR